MEQRDHTASSLAHRPGSPSESESERRFAVLSHASALLGLILPFGQLLGPYLVYLLAPRQVGDARQQAADCFNFQLGMVVFVMALSALFLWLRAGWWWFALFLPNLYAFGMAIRAATQASHGEHPRYPIPVRVLRLQRD